MLAALLAAGALLFAAPATATATPPLDLGQGYVADEVGALSAAQSAASESRLATLYESTGIDLYVALVDDFTDPSDSQQWADATAADNGLGTSQYLLAIATEGRQFYTSADSAGPLSDAQLTAIERDIRPYLSAEDYAGAIDAAAEGIEAAVGAGSGGASGGGMLTFVLIAVVVIVAIILVVVLVRRRRKGSADAGGTPQIPTEELRREAAAALVDTDDAIRTSEQELGFATAQYGEGATAEFAAALASAREKLTQAFTIQQQLDDSTPDTDEQVRAWNTQIIELCRDANAGLDEKAAAFDELRKLEQDAPGALSRVRAEQAAALAAIGGAEATLQSLRGGYAPEALETVDDNVDQARARLAFAEEQLAAAEASLTAGDTGEAVVGIRAAEEAVGQAELLEQAIATLAQDLPAAESRTAALLTELDEDIRIARTLPDPDGRVAAAVADTAARVETARRDLAATRRSPLQTLQRLEEADRTIDAVVQSARDAATQAERVGRQLDASIAQARAQISAAEGFVTSRRGAVGAEARTRLSEAAGALARAEQLRTTDPAAALRDAARANDLAARAIQAARTDVGGFALPDTGRTSGSDGFLGAILGGIISDGLSGGSRSGGGWGGGGWGGGSSSRSRSSSSRGRSSFRSGSFGGGGTRGRRGGGRF